MINKVFMDKFSTGIKVLINRKETITFGVQVGSNLKAGDIVILSGQIGAGKTTLIKGIAQFMEVKGLINSPTFLLVHNHYSRNDKPNLIHADIYKVLSNPKLDLIMLLDLISPDFYLNNSVVVIEWGESLGEILSNNYLYIHLFKDSKTNMRKAIWQWSSS